MCIKDDKKYDFYFRFFVACIHYNNIFIYSVYIENLEFYRHLDEGKKCVLKTTQKYNFYFRFFVAFI